MDDGKYNSELEVFTDVLPSSPYAKGVSWAVANGILNGTGNNKFEPEKPVTYEQLAVILHRYAQYKNCDISLNENNANYKDNINNEDYKKVSPYAITAMQWANNIGLFKETDLDLWLENNADVRLENNADVRLENQLDSEAENQLDLEQKNDLSPQNDLTQAEIANILINYSKTYS
ncbi:MAG: S-layer homology domain-containing protein [Firmicutes bacterium]|nr:S-layer homology domain-containing protein [Bacillota bacterium]